MSNLHYTNAPATYLVQYYSPLLRRPAWRQSLAYRYIQTTETHPPRQPRRSRRLSHLPVLQ